VRCSSIFSPLVVAMLQTPLSATPFPSHRYKTPGVCRSTGRLQTENVYREVLGLPTASHLSTQFR